MIAVFANQHTTRLSYVLDFCFAQKGIDYKLVTDPDLWRNQKNFRINYSFREIPCEVQIKPHGLLEKVRVEQPCELSSINGQLLLDDSSDDFSIIFFLLSRYEEYLPHERDEHDRYKAGNAALVRLGIQNKPWADILVKNLWERLELDYSSVQRKFECVPSFDIDVAWAYKHRSLVRSLGAGLRHGQIGQRLRVLGGKEQDPYDTYSHIAEIAAKVKRIICFALLGDYSKYNKNIHWKNDALGSLIRGLNATGGMGIHPSYEAHLDLSVLKNEINRLEQIVGHEIVKSRQHFLRLRIPESYEILLEAGIQRDFTMGFCDQTGFRAGTSFPFYFFNLNQNQAEKLLVFPFVYMDGVLKDQLNQTPQQAKELINQLVDEVKTVGGVFMCIWHNSSINDQGEWKGWKEVLDYTISLVEDMDFSGISDDDYFI